MAAEAMPGCAGAPDDGMLPIRSYLLANERARLFIQSARAHEQAGQRQRAIADLNAAADIEVTAGRAKRLLLPAERAVWTDAPSP
jgi:hypothetical protein